MKASKSIFVVFAVLLLSLLVALGSGAYPQQGNAAPKTSSRKINESAEGEKRFRTNCGRCHQAPHKFPPRVMAAAIRHMRVRAMITDEDMRLILRYMTQ